MDIQTANHVITKAILDIDENEAEGFISEEMKSEAQPITEGRFWDGKHVTPTTRLQWTEHEWHIEELPQKGKKKLRVANMQNPFGIFRGSRDQGPDYFMPVNILRDARLSPSDSYDKIKTKLMGAYKKALTDLKKAHGEWLDSNKWVGDMQWRENQIHYLKVKPEGMNKITAQGKDFNVTSEWDSFSAYAPGSDIHSHDRSYTQLAQKSVGAARKLYKILRADPNALRAVPWSKFTAWLDKKKVGYKHHFSVYR